MHILKVIFSKLLPLNNRSHGLSKKDDLFIHKIEEKNAHRLMYHRNSQIIDEAGNTGAIKRIQISNYN